MSDIAAFLIGLIFGVVVVISQDMLVVVQETGEQQVKVVKYKGNIYSLTPLKITVKTEADR
jgi:hypothetical protein